MQNIRNALSYLQLQDGSMEAVGKIFDRMSELRTMASDITKNSGDIENYSKEFVELQLQLDQIKNDKYNGISLFAGNGLPGNDGLKGTGFYPKSDGSQITYEKFGRILQASLKKRHEGRIDQCRQFGVRGFIRCLDPSKVQVNAMGYADRITADFAISLFTDAMGKIAGVRAENGAEQNRLRYTFHPWNPFMPIWMLLMAASWMPT